MTKLECLKNVCISVIFIVYLQKITQNGQSAAESRTGKSSEIIS
jgi:hypothetical protein